MLSRDYSQITNKMCQILVNYGDDQFTLRILDRGNTVTCTPLHSVSFISVSSFFEKIQKRHKE